jgi:hypothetical protein
LRPGSRSGKGSWARSARTIAESHFVRFMFSACTSRSASRYQRAFVLKADGISPETEKIGEALADQANQG